VIRSAEFFGSTALAVTNPWKHSDDMTTLALEPTATAAGFPQRPPLLLINRLPIKTFPIAMPFIL